MPLSSLRALPLPPAATLAMALLAGSGCATTPGSGLRPLPALSRAAVTASAEPIDTDAPADGVKAATQVVRRYYDALDRLRDQMRTAPLARLLTRGCPCREQVRAVRAAIRRDQRYTDRVRVVSMQAHQDRDDLVDVEVTLDVAHGGVVDRHGHRIGAATTARNLHRELLVHQLGDRWLIGEVLAV